MTEYLIDSATWSLGGFLLGYWFCRVERDVNEIKMILRRRRGDDDS